MGKRKFWAIVSRPCELRPLTSLFTRGDKPSHPGSGASSGPAVPAGSSAQIALRNRGRAGAPTAPVCLTLCVALVSGFLATPVFGRDNDAAFIIRGTLTNSSPQSTNQTQARYAGSKLKDLELAKADQQAASGSTIPLWRGSATYRSIKYKYTMVGQSPFSVLDNPLATVNAWLVPVTVSFRDAEGNLLHTSDPTARDRKCSPEGTAFELTQDSPIFQPFPYVVAGINIGTTQYADAFQRANFWKFVQRDNPDYSVTMKLRLGPVLDLTAIGFPVKRAPCGKLGKIQHAAWDDYLQTQAFPQLARAGVKPTDFVVFLAYNVAWYERKASDCCILSYHTAFKNPTFGGAIQTYASADYETSNSFAAFKDIYALSHAVTAWIDNPLLNNDTPAWGHIGPVSGCRTDLDTGAALIGTTADILMPNGFTYHVQDALFVPWFYRIDPSFSVDKQFSFFGTERGDAGGICH